MEFTHSKRNFFIIADDLGLAESVNDGIIFLLKKGKVDGASLMANGEAFKDAVKKLVDFPSANIGAHPTHKFMCGAHLVLVEENSFTGIKLPKNHKIFFIKYVLGLIKKSDVEKELEAQIQKILNTGIKLKFLNSHQHLHLLPGIMNIVISLAKKYSIDYVRIVNEPVKIGEKLFRKAQLVFLNFLSLLAKRKINKAGLKHNDFFVGFINAGSLSVKDLELAQKLKTLYPGKNVELGCHPGFENQKLIEKYSHWRYNWKKEIEVLQNNE